MTHYVRGTAFAVLAFVAAQPALADHGVAGGPVGAAGPILTGSPETPPAGSLSGGLELRYTKPDAYTDAELIAFAGQHVHAHTTDAIIAATASFSYGVTGHITLNASAPFVWRQDLRAGHHSHSGGVATNTVDRYGTISGFGDVAVSAKYQFAHSHPNRWGFAATGGVKIPTGSAHRTDLSGARLETEHQPGTGSWDPFVGLSAWKGWGPWAGYVSGSYQIATSGAQDTTLGDRAVVSVALVRPLGEAPHADHGGGHHHAPPWSIMVESSFEREGKQTISGVIEDDSGSEVVWLSPGVRYVAPAGWSAAVSVGVPLWQDVGRSHPDNSLRLVAQLGTRF